MQAVLALGGVSLILSYLAWRRSPTVLRGAYRNALLRFVEVLPRIAVAFLAAGFISHIVPPDVVGHSIGYESGFWGILLATLVGGITPAGPIVSFPIVVVLLSAGAGFPQVVAFLTAWSVFAFHRVVIYEVPLMGLRFSLTRLAASAILPPICGLIVWGMIAALGIGVVK
ncbi:MAG TPA: hypothetical protein VIL72_11215 [Beijerinckiaceae bacterium]|jgi:uncharacterized membrane protein YraQ (UPF0718 family)